MNLARFASLLLAVMAATAMAGAVQARDLYRVSATLQDDYFLDLDSVFRSNKNLEWRGGVVYRVLDEHSQEGSAYNAVYLATDCARQQRVAILGVTTYDKAGEVITVESIDEDAAELDWMLAPKDTHFAMVWSAMCAGEGLFRERRVGDKNPVQLLDGIYTTRKRITQQRAQAKAQEKAMQDETSISP